MNFSALLDPRWLTLLIAGCLLAALAGFALGANRSNVMVRTCPAYIAPTQASATCADGWTYAIPVANVEWTDSSGTLHDGGRPECLPQGPQQVDRVTFATVDAKMNGRAWRPVVWVSC